MKDEPPGITINNTGTQNWSDGKTVVFQQALVLLFIVIITIAYWHFKFKESVVTKLATIETVRIQYANECLNEQMYFDKLKELKQGVGNGTSR